MPERPPRPPRHPRDPPRVDGRPRTRRRRTLDVRLRRLRFAVVVAAIAAAAVILLSAGGSTPRRVATGSARTASPQSHGSAARSAAAHATRSTARATTTTVRRAAPAPRPHPRPRPHRPPAPDPGSLPQTQQLPSAETAVFHSQMRALWHGIQHNSVNEALPAFFPEGAYAQLKSIGDASGDWRNRLVGDYALDIGAAHALLGGGAQTAQLDSVRVVASYAHWIPAGVCDNSIGYYEVPNARIVYREGGALRSFGIASMISWRGVWYVVHLGAILRGTVAGVVDDPEPGTGSSAYSGTC